MDNTKALAPQEIRVLQLLAQGIEDKEIADILGIARRTANHYIYKLRNKVGIRNRILLAFYAYSKGYITKEDISEAIQRERQRKT
jgi:two-component system, NarL family, response regulator DevR